MSDPRIHFEQVPVEVAKKIAAQQVKRNLADIAEEICKEQDKAKLINLVVELNEALETKVPAK